MKLKTRKGNEKDQSWLFDLYESNMRIYVEETWGWHDEFQAKSFYKSLHPNQFNIVFSDNSDLGAYLPIHNTDHIYIEMLLIEKNFQRMGIGKWIISELKKESFELSLPIKLSVIKVNPVLTFYKKLGFTVYDEDKHFYKLSWVYKK